jgi:CRP-like cAMP-binding protein
VAVSFKPDDHPLIRQMESTASLSDEAKQALAALPMQVLDLKTDQDVVREGDRPTRCCILLEGFAVGTKVTGEGKRQILAYYMPGDIPDLQSLHLAVLDSGVATVTPCKVGFVQHETLRAACAGSPEIASALWRGTLIAASIYREWMANVGQRDARTKIAHIFCETLVRMKAIGLAEGHTCVLELTQAEIGEAAGITTVHVNRSIQTLRAEGLVSLRGSRLEALDWEGLKLVGDFDPTYLHLREPVERAALA